MKVSEHEIRQVLQRHASEFSMPPDLPNGITRRARLQRSKVIVLAGAAVLAVGALSVVFVSPARAPDQADRSAAGSASPSVPTRALRSVSYVLADPAADGSAHPHAKDGPTATVAELRQHAQCMRARGFNVPDPTRTANGWTITVDPGSLDLSSPRFREAMFVTCGPLGGPLYGDLVLGGQSQASIDRFVSCMRSQAFNLPRPTQQSNGDHVFDLRWAGIDTSLPAWNRALFVTCGPKMP